jgi:hypothetical protein
MDDKYPTNTGHPRHSSRSLRKQALKGETADKDALKLSCLDELDLYAVTIRGDGKFFGLDRNILLKLKL